MLSLKLRVAADLAREEQPALARLLDHEQVLAMEAEHAASVASDIAMSNISPAYRPSARLLEQVAYENFGDRLLNRFDEMPF